MTAREVNFDGIVGPTHNYAGLSFGNLASTEHQRQVSNPRQAALQGLQKMKFVHDLGIAQAVFPPLHRPNLSLLRRLGFRGNGIQMIESAWNVSPQLVAACFSASSMWTANAATVSPSTDSQDGKVHLTPANLCNGLHRSIETPDTTRILRAIFSNDQFFSVHDALPCNPVTSDEGAANHTRLCRDFDDPGIQMFVFGRSSLDKSRLAPQKFPARQTLEASQSVARLHRLKPAETLMIQQMPAAIDAGVFHNDVISVGNRNLLLYHQQAFVDSQRIIDSLKQKANHQGWTLFTTCIPAEQLPIADAVKSYLFNSQLLSRPDGKMTLLCPVDASEIPAAKQCTQRILAEENPVDHVEFLDLRQSMNNGGGPACLRLRVVLSDNELDAMHQGVLFNDSLYARLTDWVKEYYREDLTPDDFRDPFLLKEVDAATVALASLLQLPEPRLSSDFSD